MASEPVGVETYFMRQPGGPPPDGDPPDRRLLERFAGAGDQAAFAALVRRHGPMVLGVCRRVLGDAHEAEDAFQATFLVLARKARAVGRPEALAPWLHGVAYRAAAQARRRAVRWAREREAVPPPGGDPGAEVLWHDLREVLDEELGRLAPKYRAPLVLFYLEGKSTEEVARLLGCPKGTVQSRLARGRDRLRDRLVRRGVTLSVWALALALAERAAPAALAEGAARAAVWAAAGNGAAGALPAAVVVLTKGVLRAMFLSKLKVAAAGLLALGLAAAVVVGGARWATADGPAAAGKAAGAKDEERILGAWSVVSEEKGGREEAGADRKGLRLIFAAGGKVTQKQGEREEEGSYKLDPAKAPRQIDVTADGRTLPGIYKLEGDTLTVCVNHGGRGRPTEFASRPGTEVRLVVLKREKK